MLRGGCAHGRSSSRPGCGAKWARHRTVCAFDGGAHGDSAPLSAPIWVNPGHTERRIPSHTQLHAVGATRPPFMAARAIFVPEFESAGSPFCASGPGGTVSNPNTPPRHMHRWIRMVVPYVRCTGCAHVQHRFLNLNFITATRMKTGKSRRVKVIIRAQTC